jgi:hypothetical protein
MCGPVRLTHAWHVLSFASATGGCIQWHLPQVSGGGWGVGVVGGFTGVGGTEGRGYAQGGPEVHQSDWNGLTYLRV